MRVLTIWLCLSLASYPVAIADDAPRDSGLVLRSTTRLVQLNVIVQKGGQPASGLKKDDFVVTDNGKPQTIAVFSENSNGALPGSGISVAALPPNTFTNRLEQRAGAPANITVILLDDLN